MIVDDPGSGLDGLTCHFTEKELAQQLLLIACVLMGRKHARHYQAETRHILERIRDGAATPEEAELVLEAVRMMNEQGEINRQTNRSRQVYALTLKYITPEKFTNQEIAEVLHLDKSTVFRDVSTGIARLAVLLFGLVAIEFK